MQEDVSNNHMNMLGLVLLPHAAFTRVSKIVVVKGQARCSTFCTAPDTPDLGKVLLQD